MSPARSKRQPIPHRRRRNEIVQAVAVSVAIVVVTAFFVWMLRPGPPGIRATGGLMNRQPRASWLVFGAIGLSLLATWWVLRGSRRARSRAKVALPVSLGLVAAAAVAGGFAWPGGLLRHDVAPPPAPTTTTPSASSTSAPTATTAAGGATSTTGPASATTATTRPAATTAPGTSTSKPGGASGPSGSP